MQQQRLVPAVRFVASAVETIAASEATALLTWVTRAAAVRGNPLSKTNHGYVCPRGHMIPQQLYGPDRVKVPMKRTNPAKGRGIDPKFVPITWDEALDTVAEKMIALRKAGEPLLHGVPGARKPFTFVEDTAVILDEAAVLTRPGSPSRRPETASIARALEPFRKLLRIEAPGTIDGGDVLRLGRRILSRRYAAWGSAA